VEAKRQNTHSYTGIIAGDRAGAGLAGTSERASEFRLSSDRLRRDESMHAHTPNTVLNTAGRAAMTIQAFMVLSPSESWFSDFRCG